MPLRVVDVDGHDIVPDDIVVIVSRASAQKVGTRARVHSLREAPDYVDLRWNEQSGGGANAWICKAAYVRFVHRDGHDCALCAVLYVDSL